LKKIATPLVSPTTSPFLSPTIPPKSSPPPSPSKAQKAAQPFKITIKKLTGDPVNIDQYTAETTIGELKEKIYAKEDLKPYNQMLIFAGKHLSDNNKSLKDYNVQKESTMHLLTIRTI
jgi:hypothetical protein